MVIPTRDRWDLLSTGSVPSALWQEDVELEVVVVDDGSGDRTSELLAALGDERVRVVRHDRPLGVARARNAGIWAARGAWIAFLDDDDLWSPRKLRRQIDAATLVGAEFAYGGAAAIADDRSWLYSLAPVDPETLASALLSQNVLWGGSSNVIVSADQVRSLGGFDERLFQICDWDLWIRLALSARGVAVDEVLVGCVVHERSMLLVSEDDVFEELAYLRTKHRDPSKELGVELDRRTFTRWVALGHRRAGRRFASVATYLRGVVQDGDVANIVRAADALLGSKPAPHARPRSRSFRANRNWRFASTAEPDWLARYRSGDALNNAQATSKASSPVDL